MSDGAETKKASITGGSSHAAMSEDCAARQRCTSAVAGGITEGHQKTTMSGIPEHKSGDHKSGISAYSLQNTTMSDIPTKHQKTTMNDIPTKHQETTMSDIPDCILACILERVSSASTRPTLEHSTCAYSTPNSTQDQQGAMGWVEGGEGAGMGCTMGRVSSASNPIQEYQGGMPPLHPNHGIMGHLEAASDPTMEHLLVCRRWYAVGAQVLQYYAPKRRTRLPPEEEWMDEIAALPGLTSIDVQDGACFKVTDRLLHSISRCCFRRLTTLSITTNDTLSHFSPSACSLLFQSCTRLTSLSLLLNICNNYNNNSGETLRLPETISCLVSLTQLSVSGCSLPSSLTTLPLLTKLEIHKAGEDDVPFSLSPLSPSLHSLILEAWSSFLLPQGLCSLSNLTHLSITAPNVGVLPEDMGQLKKLRCLSLGMLSLREVPDTIGSLASLVHLSVESHCLRDLPLAISRLTQLRFLEISGSMILQNAPQLLEPLTELKSLSLDCPRADLPLVLGSINAESAVVHLRYEQDEPLHQLTVPDCRRLQRLQLDDVSSWPVDLGEMVNLVHLSVAGLEYSLSLPDSASCLLSLRTLHLEDCPRMKRLPSSLASLTSLTSLHLVRLTSMATLPNVVGQMASLRELEISGCTSLSSLGHSLGSLKQLSSLSLVYLPCLEELLVEIGQLKSLKFLRVESCSKLRSLPDSLGFLTGLRDLQLFHLSEVNRLPDSISGLKSLCNLQLHGLASLHCLPINLGSLASLKELQLIECHALECLSDSISGLTSLRVLILARCARLRSLPKGIGRLHSLLLLALCTLPLLKSIPDSIGQTKHLRQLHLFGLPCLNHVPESVLHLQDLREVRLSFCSGLKSLPDFVSSRLKLTDESVSDIQTLLATLR